MTALTVAACGVTFSEDFEGTELFKSISLGDTPPGGSQGGNSSCTRQAGVWECSGVDQLTVSFEVTNGYPVLIQVACFYEEPDALTDDQLKVAFHERATRVGEKVLMPVEGRRPDDDVPRELLSFTFDAPPPGEYFLACLTPAAPDNGLGLGFRME
jgi:hypothetical protein